MALRAAARTTQVVRACTAGEAAAYRRHGAVCLRNAVPPCWLDALRAGVDANRANPGPHAEVLRGPSGSGAYFGDYLNWRRIPEYTSFVVASGMAEVAAQLMDSTSVAFYHEHVLVKDAGTDKETPYHHDQPYYPIDGNQVCSIWLPLDPVPSDQGIRFVSGSHTWDKWFFPRKFATGNAYESSGADLAIHDPSQFLHVPDDLDSSPDHEILAWDVQPGDVIAFHMRTLHAAASTKQLRHPRRVFVSRWLGDDTVFVQRPWETSPPINADVKWGDSALTTNEYPVLWARDLDETAAHLDSLIAPGCGEDVSAPAGATAMDAEVGDQVAAATK